MASRSERREAARLEAGIKLIFVVIVGFAFLIGGVSGFVSVLSVLGSLFLWLSLLGVVALAVALVLKSRLVLRKKLGILSVLFALFVLTAWQRNREPRPWTEQAGTVVSIDGSAAVTETNYTYQPTGIKKGVPSTATFTRPWANLYDANQFKAGPIVIYYDPANPNVSSFNRRAGWYFATGMPASTRLRVLSFGTATLRIDALPTPIMATITGPRVESYTIGMSLPVWINPVSRGEWSLVPQSSPGGRSYWTLALALMLGVVGMAAVATGKQWRAPVDPNPQPAFCFQQSSQSAPAPSPTIAEMLRRIDWFQFEAVAGRILEADGWSVRRSGGSHPDGGADILAMRSGQRAVVQCKHWRRVMIQPHIIRELIGTKVSAQFSSDVAMLFSLSDCTEAALECAKSNGIIIYDSRAVENAIARIGVGCFPELINPNDKMCPKCGAPMVLRVNATNPFWGCTTFPGCRGKIEQG